MSQFTDKHRNDLQLQLNAKIRRVREQLPTYADAFVTRITEDIEKPTATALERGCDSNL